MEKNGKYDFIIGNILGLYRNSGNDAGNDYLDLGFVLGSNESQKDCM